MNDFRSMRDIVGEMGKLSAESASSLRKNLHGIGNRVVRIRNQRRKPLNEEQQAAELVVKRAIAYLKATESTHVRGLFSTKAIRSDVVTLREWFQRANLMEFADRAPKVIRPHAVAQLLLEQLGRMEEPLLTTTQYEAFTLAVKLPKRQKRLYVLRLLLQRLPSESFSLTCALVDILGMFCFSKYDVDNNSLCDIYRVAKIFSSLILRRGSHRAEKTLTRDVYEEKDMTHDDMVVVTLISEREYLFKREEREKVDTFDHKASLREFRANREAIALSLAERGSSRGRGGGEPEKRGKILSSSESQHNSGDHTVAKRTTTKSKRPLPVSAPPTDKENALPSSRLSSLTVDPKMRKEERKRSEQKEQTASTTTSSSSNSNGSSDKKKLSAGEVRDLRRFFGDSDYPVDSLVKGSTMNDDDEEEDDASSEIKSFSLTRGIARLNIDTTTTSATSSSPGETTKVMVTETPQTPAAIAQIETAATDRLEKIGWSADEVLALRRAMRQTRHSSDSASRGSDNSAMTHTQAEEPSVNEHNVKEDESEEPAIDGENVEEEITSQVEVYGAVPEEEKVSLSKTSLQFLEKTLLNEKINKYRVDKEKDNGEERDHLPPSQITEEELAQLAEFEEARENQHVDNSETEEHSEVMPASEQSEDVSQATQRNLVDVVSDDNKSSEASSSTIEFRAKQPLTSTDDSKSTGKEGRLSEDIAADPEMAKYLRYLASKAKQNEKLLAHEDGIVIPESGYVLTPTKTPPGKDKKSLPDNMHASLLKKQILLEVMKSKGKNSPRRAYNTAKLPEREKSALAPTLKQPSKIPPAPPPPPKAGISGKIPVAPPPPPKPKAASIPVPPPPPPKPGSKIPIPPPPPPKPGSGIPPPPPLPPPQRPGIPIPPPPPGSKLSGVVSAASMSHKMKLRLKQLHWKKLNDKVDLSGTVWAEESDNDCDNFELDISELERLFALEDSKLKVVKRKVNQTVHLIDIKRAHNLQIQLSGVRLSDEEIREGLLEMDVDLFNEEQLTVLLAAIPTQKERDIIKGYKGEVEVLGKVEKYFIKVLDIPRLQQRVESLLFRTSYEPNVAKITAALELVQNASKQVRESQQVAKILKAVLAVGNHLNGGTIRGAASGFKLETLSQIANVKGKDRKTSLLHFIIREMMKREGAGNILLCPALPCIAKATNISIDILKQQITTVRNGLNKINDEILHASVGSESNIHDNFRDTMIEFANEAEDGVTKLNTSFKETMASLTSLAVYFGEEFREDNAIKVLKTLKEFVFTYDKVHEEVMAALAREVKEKEDAKMKVGQKRRMSVDMGSLGSIGSAESTNTKEERVPTSSKDDEAEKIDNQQAKKKLKSPDKRFMQRRATVIGGDISTHSKDGGSEGSLLSVIESSPPPRGDLVLSENESTASGVGGDVTASHSELPSIEECSENSSSDENVSGSEDGMEEEGTGAP